MIYCCSERSVYDPARGARVLAGPAPQPLTAILLEHDPATDHYYATGTLGGELYDRFFSSFGFRVALEHGNDNIRERTGDTVVAYPPDHYSVNPVRC